MSTITKDRPAKKKRAVNLCLLAAVVVLAVLPLLLVHDAEFGGADGQAEAAITEIKADYQPWFQPLWEPPSSEIESLLFALQAALGAGFIGYYFGFRRGKKNSG
ncbi:energy-coupling factor ABC transporter substrate-binding protein [Desulforamulus hydrothermalis]|uniref:Cobalt transport protein CbiN n=1 Tax=Desulforamulus hydrothermalis Lam5 = DSM 18033 TaxID=1121428 RepID=K8DYL3_9FIRM|nr:energy-coupling factor ABC transporter substrate-binding protein [Desulforamulus hydrothermalis]CCO07997.1 Cobalt transport protein CbiN [Desulforamulus hydrothermalis Lam5 = DSM 18033]SHG84518.1 cobalt/nickel transport protein [Desulforamulus hydrothermalis Lam5 = DSM 18033]